jgi:hypothetical protein
MGQTKEVAMRNLVKVVTGALNVLILASVAVAADVQTTVDPKADFSRFRTFTFLQSDPTDKGAIADEKVRERLQYMIARQLNGRGYKPAAPGRVGDLGVHFTGHVVAKQRALMTGRPAPYSYSWGRGELGGQETLDYRQGTLFVDLVDLSRGQLVWRTRVSEALTSSYSEENWKKAERALGEAFKKLPQGR